ncbi:gamma-glutamyl-gamma-aminobutyrate hydrolase family protein [Acidiphilium sp. AL]|uniref:Gamma-glutamyl-gamma-aminobutyrate hydrolase family protein n=1 Tax=Acidiphilium iwatense TaxID=768198 RepID=A0ABS9E3B1_9PROT|nr:MULTISPECIES: gamma-glutamyl-gamma-aminobutyrate hydrolase family protein [Acidiphilium]MCF3948074.1 gamma-glutamyl-gamma-aminobutyrate hydrolase family protein [Acidiphilium iwatense]MCU4162054.1 gamma-glutamyl-gamma-aminobutyrate hydrolase family protein [Acidiphilium sp. AL]
MIQIIGIPACTRIIANHHQHATPARYGEALIRAADAIPLLIPPEGERMIAVLDRLDGILFDGSPSNVAPARYGVARDATPDVHDPDRDATTLPLIQEALARGMPIFGICRGMQELNVALGGTLHQEVHEVAGRTDHRAGTGTRAEQFAIKHEVALTGALARIVSAATIMVNSVHGQAIDRLAPGLVVEGVAPDGTIEAVRVETASGFALAVQWHPEWEVMAYPDRARLFAAFGQACAAYRQGLARAA